MSLDLKSALASLLVRLESLAFDLRHGVTTRFDARTDSVPHGNHGYYSYLPTRPSVAAKLLRNIPVGNCGDYTFVDFGSGKGRMLLLAAKLPYQAIHGIELNPELHAQAVGNVRRCRTLDGTSERIHCLNIDATEYEFPDTNVVLYFFNPFGPEIMLRVLNRMSTWTARTGHQAIVVTVYPELESLERFVPQLQPVFESDRVRIYATH